MDRGKKGPGTPKDISDWYTNGWGGKGVETTVHLGWFSLMHGRRGFHGIMVLKEPNHH